jgi:hypothetical protein
MSLLNPDSMGAYFLEQSIDAEFDGYPSDEYGDDGLHDIICRKCGEDKLYWKNDGVTKSGWSLYKLKVRHSCILKDIKENK